MIVRSLRDIEGTARDVAWGNGQSRRLLLAQDGMGYSVTDTIVNAGSTSFMQYTNHLESCYCIEGEGEIECAGNVYPISPGTFYALDRHDPHALRAKTRMRLICIFAPPLRGEERHHFLPDEHSRY